MKTKDELTALLKRGERKLASGKLTERRTEALTDHMSEWYFRLEEMN